MVQTREIEKKYKLNSLGNEFNINNILFVSNLNIRK